MSEIISPNTIDLIMFPIHDIQIQINSYTNWTAPSDACVGFLDSLDMGRVDVLHFQHAVLVKHTVTHAAGVLRLHRPELHLTGGAGYGLL